MAKKAMNQFAVLGLGRFGQSIVRTLAEYDVNILVCDRDGGKLEDASDYATHVIRVDLSDEKSIEKLGLGNFDVVILAMGEDFEASLMAAMVAKEQGAKFVMVKARNYRQRTILESIGVDQVVLPEHEMGAKIARKLITPNIMDILEESEHYTIAEMHPREDWIGKSLRQADIRRKHHLMILGVRRGKTLHIPVSPDLVLLQDDILITLSEHK